MKNIRIEKNQLLRFKNSFKNNEIHKSKYQAMKQVEVDKLLRFTKHSNRMQENCVRNNVIHNYL